METDLSPFMNTLQSLTTRLNKLRTSSKSGYIAITKNDDILLYLHPIDVLLLLEEDGAISLSEFGIYDKGVLDSFCQLAKLCGEKPLKEVESSFTPEDLEEYLSTYLWCILHDPSVFDITQHPDGSIVPPVKRRKQFENFTLTGANTLSGDIDNFKSLINNGGRFAVFDRENNPQIFSFDVEQTEDGSTDVQLRHYDPSAKSKGFTTIPTDDIGGNWVQFYLYCRLFIFKNFVER